MKKLYSVILVLLLTATVSFAQGYQKDSKVLNAGVGFGLYGMDGSATLPPISAGLQFGITDKISAGGIIGIAGSSYDFGSWYGKDYSWSYTYIIIGARGEYHYLEPENKLDAYGGVTLGYTIVNVSEPDGWEGYGYSATGSYALYGFHAGARYALTPSIGVFGELGYGIGYFTVGATFKL